MTSLGGIGLIDYTVLPCRRFDPTVAFYRDVMGFPLAVERDGRVNFQVGPTVLALARRDDSGAPAASVQLAFRVEMPEVDRCHAELTARGVLIERGPVDLPAWGHRAIFFRDPEGTLIEIYAEVAPPAGT